MTKRTTGATVRGSIINWRMQASLISGIATVCAILFVVVGITNWEVTNFKGRIDNLCVPNGSAGSAKP